MKIAFLLKLFLISCFSPATKKDPFTILQTKDSAEIVVFHSTFRIAASDHLMLRAMDTSIHQSDTIKLLDIDSAKVILMEKMLEKHLGDVVKKAKESHYYSRIYSDLGHYQRQYICYRVRDLPPRVLINCAFDYPGEEKSDMTSIFLVHDGGDSFWNIKYDPAAEQFFELAVNGPG